MQKQCFGVRTVLFASYANQIGSIDFAEINTQIIITLSLQYSVCVCVCSVVVVFVSLGQSKHNKGEKGVVC